MNETKTLTIHDKVLLIEKKRKELLKRRSKKEILFGFTFFTLLIGLTFVPSILCFMYVEDSSTIIKRIEIFIKALIISICISPIIAIPLIIFLSLFFGEGRITEEYNSFIKSKISLNDLEFCDLQIKDIGKLRISSIEYLPEDIKQIIEDFSEKTPDNKNQNENKKSYTKYNGYFIIERENEKLHAVSFSKHILQGDSDKKEFSFVAVISKRDKSKVTQEENIQLNNSQLKSLEVEKDKDIYRIYYHYVTRDISQPYFSLDEKFTLEYLEKELKKVENYFTSFFYSPETLVDLGSETDSNTSDGSDGSNGSDTGAGYY